MQRLSGKKAFVTAAGQGIGRRVAEMFAAEGASVIATDLNGDLLDDLNGIETSVLDVTNGAAVKAAIEAAGKLDVLFNCAGFVHNGSMLECSEEDWDFSFNLNVRSMYQPKQHYQQCLSPAVVLSLICLRSLPV